MLWQQGEMHGAAARAMSRISRWAPRAPTRDELNLSSIAAGSQHDQLSLSSTAEAWPGATSWISRCHSPP